MRRSVTFADIRGKHENSCTVETELIIGIKEYASKIEDIDNKIVTKQSELVTAAVTKDMAAYTSIRNEIDILKATRAKYVKNKDLLCESIERNT